MFNAGFIFFYCTVRIISLNILKLLGTLTLKQFIHFLLLLTLILYKVYVFGFDKKTTTFHILSGVMEASGGQVTIFGKVPKEARPFDVCRQINAGEADGVFFVDIRQNFDGFGMEFAPAS